MKQDQAQRRRVDRAGEADTKPTSLDLQRRGRSRHFGQGVDRLLETKRDKHRSILARLATPGVQ